MKKMSDYAYHIGVQFRAYPSYKQIDIIRKNGGAARFVYNRLTAVNNEKFLLRKSAQLCPADRERLSFLEENYKDAVHIKNMVPFLWNCDSDMVLHAMANYQKAWNTYKTVPGAGIPAFHKFDYTYRYQTSNHYSAKKLNFCKHVIGLYEGSVRIEDQNHLILPGIGRIRVKGSPKPVRALLARTCETRIGTVTIQLDACGDAWITLSLASDTSFHDAYPETHQACGMDMNLTNFLTDSDGLVIPSPRYMKQAEEKLVKAQKSVSRKYEAAKREKRDYRKSRNYQEARKKLARCHRHVAKQRLDFARCTADREVKSHDYLFAEDLQVHNLKLNHKLAKAIADSGWRQYLIELQHTASKRGKTCLLVNPKYTTQTCSTCGHVMKGDDKIVLGVEEWTCPVCGTHHIRDLNAAINIKNTGLALLRESGVPISIRE